MCALSDTLILDEDGVYDPAHFNDRLLLVLRGKLIQGFLRVSASFLFGGMPLLTEVHPA
jgi:hypothetical protein